MKENKNTRNNVLQSVTDNLMQIMNHQNNDPMVRVHAAEKLMAHLNTFSSSELNANSDDRILK